MSNAPTSQCVASPPHKNPFKPSTTENVLTHPQRDLQGWLVVLGSSYASLFVFGVVNTAGIFESFLSENQLTDKSKSRFPGWPDAHHIPNLDPVRGSRFDTHLIGKSILRILKTGRLTGQLNQIALIQSAY